MKELIKSAVKKLGFEIKRVPDGTIHYPYTAWLAQYGIRTMIDIGASSGSFARTMRDRHPEVTIYSFEPLADCFAEMQRRLEGAPKFKAFNFALGEENKEAEIHRSVYSPSSSLLPMADLHRTTFPQTAGDAGVEKIQVRRLDDVVKELTLEDGIFVKIDVQGFERAVLRGGLETIRRARVLVMETSFAPLYEGQPLFEEMHRSVCELGFQYAGNWDQLTDPVTGGVLQADAIFIRPAA